MVLEQTLTEAGGAVNVTARSQKPWGQTPQCALQERCQTPGECVSPSAQLVTAPSEAEETCLAYFAITPEV